MRLYPTLVLLLAGVVLSACGSDDDASPPATTIGETDAMVAELCAVLNAASADELEAAQSTFDHRPLHTLADTVADIDRGVAASLLEAKEAVEADLSAPAVDGAALVSDLNALVAATADAVVATGAQRPPPCDSENQ